MAFAGKTALAILERIGNDNRKGEFYLTDAVAIARAMKLQGGRDRDRGGRRARHQHQGAARGNRSRVAAALAQGGAGRGVTLIAPETVFLAADTKFGRDVTVEPTSSSAPASRSRTMP